MAKIKLHRHDQGDGKHGSRLRLPVIRNDVKTETWDVKNGTTTSMVTWKFTQQIVPVQNVGLENINPNANSESRFCHDAAKILNWGLCLIASLLYEHFISALK